MQRLFLVLTGVLVCGSGTLAGYDFVIEDGYASMTLNDHETLLMKGGGGYHFTLSDNSLADIQNTSALVEFQGGIWWLQQVGYSHLDFSSGGIHELDLGNYATATLSGGRIDIISSSQKAWKWDGDPPQYVPDPHIEIIYSGELPTVDENNLLTGAWGNGSPFSIQLIDMQGYSPTIENIFFIPEPATLVLFGLGGVLLRRRRCA